MARQRMIKPEFYDSPTVNSCSLAARYLFIGLWVQADDYGRLKYQPSMLRLRVFGYDRMTPQKVEKLLDELAAVKCIEFYEVDGERYINIPNFNVYQTIQRPSKSTIPDPSESRKRRDSTSTHGALNEHSMSTHTKEVSKERSIRVSKENSNANELRGAAVGAAAASAAPPSAPSCPKCGTAMEITAAHKRKQVMWSCPQCGEEVWLDG